MADFPIGEYLQAFQTKYANEEANNPSVNIARGITAGVGNVVAERQKTEADRQTKMFELIKDKAKGKIFKRPDGKPASIQEELSMWDNVLNKKVTVKASDNPERIMEFGTKDGNSLGYYYEEPESMKATSVIPTAENIDMLKKSLPGYNIQLGVAFQLPTNTYNQIVKGTTKLPEELPEQKLARIKAESTARAEGTVAGSKGGGAVDTKMFEQENKIRDDFRKDAGEYPKIRDSYTRIVQSAKDPSAAGDLALIFNYMKILDPGSVVREGEFATAQNSGSVPDIIRARYNKVINGERLAPNIRADFLDRATKLYQGQEMQFKKTVDDYTKRSKAYGLNPQRVMGDYMIATPVEKKKRFEILEVK